MGLNLFRQKTHALLITIIIKIDQIGLKKAF